MDKKYFDFDLDFKKLKNPPKEYRPIPFWSWNSRLKAEETKWQIDEMSRIGNGGYFMHARGGLLTPYLGDEWFDNVRAAIEEGEKTGMGTWGYDENGWPSGFGGGAVNGKGLDYQQKYLRVKESDEPVNDDRTITNIKCDASEQKYLHFYYDVNEYYVDTLNPTATDEFIRVVHQRYKDELGDDFKKLAGFFTDEPQVSRNGIPWSFLMPDEYQKAYGDTLIDKLSDLFYPTETSSVTRFRFWKLVTEMFADNFLGRIYNWCEKNGSMVTGHMVLEENLHAQLTSNGACMPNYEFLHIPGVDKLGRGVDRHSALVQQAASVSHQLGKKQILSETFALCGWDVSFEDMKHIYEWQTVRGVTLLCQHLLGYTLAGIRKRDYPAGHFYQNPWWEEYYRFVDYSSRIGVLLSDGKVNFHTLMLHPQSSAWIYYDSSEQSKEKFRHYNRSFPEAMIALESNQIQYHLGDERIMRRHGKVENGKLIVGTQSYEAVVVPPMCNLSSEVFALVSEFRNQGGCVIFTDEMPEMIDGEKTDRIKEAFNGCKVVSINDIASALPESEKYISIKKSDGTTPVIDATVREFDGMKMYYFANTFDKACDCTITLPGVSAEFYDALSSETKPLTFKSGDGKISFDYKFEDCGSFIIFVYDDDRCVSDESEKIQLNPINDILPTVWTISEPVENSLVLDYCDVQLNNDEPIKDVHILDVQEMACDYYKEIPLKLTFRANIKELPDSNTDLVVETPEIFTITINGKSCPNTAHGYFWDKTFKRIDVTEYLKEGENEIILETMFSQTPETYDHYSKSRGFEAVKNCLAYDMEIDAIYLVGKFGVVSDNEFKSIDRRGIECDGGFYITKQPETVTLGSLANQGFPFFNEIMTLKSKVTVDEPENRSISFDRLPTTVTTIKANEKEAGTIIWRPYEVSLANLLNKGENEIEITLTGNLRNLLGPHHLGEESYGVGPGSFFRNSPIWSWGKNRSWKDTYVFVEYGIFLK